jgi:hypothetical protein
MISCHRVLLVLSILGILSVPYSWGQAPAIIVSGGIPATVKSAPIIDAAAEAQIKTYLNEQLQKFREVNTDGVTKARENIIAEAKGGGAAFLAKYAELLNGEILGILKDVKDAKARLNAAIVVARVADIANNTKLEKCVLALLDKTQPEAMRIWGMRAARPVLPELLKVNGEKPMIEAIVATVKQFPANGPMCEDAYDALNPRNTATKSVPTIVDALLDLTDWRISIYKDGLPGGGGKTLLPDEPEVDSTPFTNIFNQGVLVALDKNKKQDVRAVQLACDLMAYSAVRGETPAYRSSREQLQSSISRISGGIFVVASTVGDNNVAALAKDASSRAMQQAVDLVALIHPLCDAVPKMKGFEDVHVPAILQNQGGGTAQDGGAGNAGNNGGAANGGAANGGNIPGAVVQPVR